MSGVRPGEMRIGEELEAERTRAGLSLAQVEERTKIRARYLQALEDERWHDLPSVAYGKAFLRSYARALGLDDEALVDEYRRQVEGGGVQEGASSRPRLGLLIGVAALVLVAAVVLVALLGGDDVHKATRGPAKGDRGGGGDGNRDRKPAANGETVKLALVVSDPVEVCLVGGGGEALIDGQVLNAGDRDHFARRSFELRFPSGFDPSRLKVKVAGAERKLPRARGPATYEITPPQHVRLAGKPPGKGCP